MDRWIAARPWESRVAAQESPKKAQNGKPNKTLKNSVSPTCKAADKVKLVSPNGKAVARKARKLSYEASEKIPAHRVNPKADAKESKNEKEVS